MPVLRVECRPTEPTMEPNAASSWAAVGTLRFISTGTWVPSFEPGAAGRSDRLRGIPPECTNTSSPRRVKSPGSLTNDPAITLASNGSLMPLPLASNMERPPAW